MELQRNTQKLNNTTRERDILYSQLKTIKTAAKFINMYSARINQPFPRYKFDPRKLIHRNLTTLLEKGIFYIVN